MSRTCRTFFISLLYSSPLLAEQLNNLETAFNIFEHKCTINILFFNIHPDFLVKETPISLAIINFPLNQYYWKDEIGNPKNLKLWPSWKTKHMQCIVNTVLPSRGRSVGSYFLKKAIQSFFGDVIDTIIQLTDPGSNLFPVYHMKPPNYFMFIDTIENFQSSRNFRFVA